VTCDVVGCDVESDFDVVGNSVGLLVGLCVVGLVVGFAALIGSFVDGTFVGERVCFEEDSSACAFPK